VCCIFIAVVLSNLSLFYFFVIVCLCLAACIGEINFLNFIITSFCVTLIKFLQLDIHSYCVVVFVETARDSDCEM